MRRMEREDVRPVPRGEEVAPHHVGGSLRAVVTLKPVVDDGGPERQGSEVRARTACRAHRHALRRQ